MMHRESVYGTEFIEEGDFTNEDLVYDAQQNN